MSLCYTGNTFINNSSYRGRLKETTQMGVEHIGDESADADAELLAMTVECLLAAGLTEFQVSVGQVDYFKSLLKEAELDTEAEERLRTLISQKNSFGVQEFVEEQKLKEVNNNLAELENSIRQQNIHITDTYGPYLGKEYLDTDKLMELSRIIQAGTASNITEAIEMDKNGERKPEKN